MFLFVMVTVHQLHAPFCLVALVKMVRLDYTYSLGVRREVGNRPVP